MTEGEISSQAEEDVEADRHEAIDYKSLHQGWVTGIELRQSRVGRERIKKYWSKQSQRNKCCEKTRIFLRHAEHGLVLHHALAAEKATRTGE